MADKDSWFKKVSPPIKPPTPPTTPRLEQDSTGLWKKYSIFNDPFFKEVKVQTVTGLQYDEGKNKWSVTYKNVLFGEFHYLEDAALHLSSIMELDKTNKKQ